MADYRETAGCGHEDDGEAGTCAGARYLLQGQVPVRGPGTWNSLLLGCAGGSVLASAQARGLLSPGGGCARRGYAYLDCSAGLCWPGLRRQARE